MTTLFQFSLNIPFHANTMLAKIEWLRQPHMILPKMVLDFVDSNFPKAEEIHYLIKIVFWNFPVEAEIKIEKFKGKYYAPVVFDSGLWHDSVKFKPWNQSVKLDHLDWKKLIEDAKKLK